MSFHALGNFVPLLVYTRKFIFQKMRRNFVLQGLHITGEYNCFESFVNGNKGLREILRLGVVLFMRIFREKDSFTGIVERKS